MSDMQQTKKPDPLGGVDVVLQSINAGVDCSSEGSMSATADPHGPNLSPPTISSYSIPNAISSQNTNNEVLTVGLISNSTNDGDDSCSADLDHKDAHLLSTSFPHQALLLNHIQQYSYSRGFMTSHHAKDHFTVAQYEILPRSKLSCNGQSKFKTSQKRNILLFPQIQWCQEE